MVSYSSAVMRRWHHPISGPARPTSGRTLGLRVNLLRYCHQLDRIWFAGRSAACKAVREYENRMTRGVGGRAKSRGHSEVAVQLKRVTWQERMASVATQTPSKSGNALHRSECFLWMFHLVQRTIRRLEQ